MTEQAANPSDDSWAQVKDLVADALDRPIGERRTFLEGACDGDVALRRRVERLLAVHDSAESFFDHTPTVDLPAEISAGGGAPEPERVGQYRILRRIASGGAGTVYLAVQDRPHRTVALKLLRAGMHAPELARRFEQESEVLASLHHPAIAHVYEAGVHGEGVWQTPYIAMELVRDARTIIAWAEASRLRIEQRLELFITVCEAVQHAHDRGFVHRDLKPPNILVDSAGHAKVIDFGVARIMESEDEREPTQHTSAGDIVGTLLYMAPEQCGGAGQQIDKRADVYALGVVLFELLAGRLPLTLAGMRIDQAIDAIRMQAPARLIRVAPQAGRDLDAITGRSLEKDPQRRYQTAAALAADVRRCLDHQPIVARAPGVFYRARLFARRHRVAAIAVIATMGILVGATVVSTSFALWANRSARVAGHEHEIAQGVSSRLSRMLAVPDPHRRGADVTVVEMLDLMIEDLDATEELPEIELAVRQAAGETYLNIDRVDQALRQFERCAEIQRQTQPDSPALALTLNNIGLAHMLAERYVEAERAHRESIAIARDLPPDDVDMAMYLGNLAAVLVQRDNYGEARNLLREVIALRAAEHGPTHLYVIANMRKLANLHARHGEYELAEPLLQSALQAVRETLPESHPLLTATLGEMGRVLADMDRPEAALAALDESWRVVSEHRTPGSYDWKTALERYQKFLLQLDRVSQTEALLTEALNQVEAARGPDSPEAIEVREALVGLYR